MTHDPITLFFDAVAKTGLLEEPTLTTLTQEIRTEGAASQEEVAAKLVQRQLLTPYQAERLLIGEGQDCILAGRYHLLEKVGTGGMGSVFRARDTQLDRIVAVKVMAPHRLSDADAVARFKREARALAQLALPNVVQAFDSGEDHGRNFLVMEFVKGVGLHQLVRDKGKLPPTIAADYIYQTAIGMQRAHERGMVHRDLKPANLLLTSDGAIKILDLGLARFLQDQLPDSEITRDNVGLGTPDYMAPEQFRDARNVDPRADIYALGCSLYFLITGLVPFPGSSLSEKAHAHENKEPPPLEERSPEVPAGLALVVSKMMAKRPADRFQSMRAVAEALAPYVAGSSPSLPSIKQTVSFLGDQFITGRRPPDQRPLLIAGGVTIAALTIALLAFLLPRLWNTGEAPDDKNLTAQNGSQQGDVKTPTSNEKEPAGDGPKKKPEDVKPKPPEPLKAVTIPNGLTVAQDGTGQFKTISAALDKIQAGQTIRVLDDAVYVEELTINRATQHVDVTLEAAKKATIMATASIKDLIEIQNVKGFTLRGFQLKAEGTNILTFVRIKGHCPGVVIEKLDVTAPARDTGLGIENDGTELAPAEAPVQIRGNILHNLNGGITVSGCGFGPHYKVAIPVGQTIIADNLITDCNFGITLQGAIRQIQVSGNRIVRAKTVAVQLENLLAGAEDILITNNTVFESDWCGFRIWDSAVKGKNIQLCNNLFLGCLSEKELINWNSGGDPHDAVGPGNGPAVSKAWSFLFNWREHAADLNNAKGLIPPGAKDKVQPKIEVMSREQSNKNFLRPDKDSPLATQGAGTEDIAFPVYVGAVPPEGAEPWNWQWTWDAWMHKTLTVSQDAKDNARFKTINAAMDKMKPGWTIRIMDDAVYHERLLLNDPAQLTGISVISPRHATIEGTDKGNLIEVKNVPDVTVAGLHLHGKSANGLTLMAVFSGCQGMTVRHVDFLAEESSCFGLEILGGPDQKAGAQPIRIHDCRFEGMIIGCELVGTDLSLQLSLPPKGILLCNNHFRNCQQAIKLFGPAQEVLIAGNLIVGAKGSGVHLEAMMPALENILIVNNSMLDSVHSVRFWSTKVQGDKIHFMNNLILAPYAVDMTFVDALSAPSFKLNGPGDVTALLKVCQFSHNWREAKKATGDDAYSKGWIPPQTKDVLEENIAVASRNPKHKDFLRPAKDSKLATEGVGTDDPDLPPFIGAVPPEDMKAWDWEKTWKAKFERPRSVEK